jgi:hypothetical protein
LWGYFGVNKYIFWLIFEREKNSHPFKINGWSCRSLWRYSLSFCHNFKPWLWLALKLLLMRISRKEDYWKIIVCMWAICVLLTPPSIQFFFFTTWTDEVNQSFSYL